MKKGFKALAISLGLLVLVSGGLSAEAAAKKVVKKTVAKKTVVSSFVWTADAKKLLNRVPAGVRPSVKKKTEAYAKRHGIKVITLAVEKAVRD